MFTTTSLASVLVALLQLLLLLLHDNSDSADNKQQTYILDEPWRAIQHHFRVVFVYYTCPFLVPHQNHRQACAEAIELYHLLKPFVLIRDI